MTTNTQQIFKDFQVLSILIKKVPFKNIGAYGDGLSFDVMNKCEKIAAKTIVENNIDITARELHLFRSTLNLSEKQFAKQLGISVANIKKWENNGKIPKEQKFLIKAFMRQVYNLSPIDFSQLKTFNKTNKIETNFFESEKQ
jgi:DNA-binding transcriptional regulator YiaG